MKRLKVIIMYKIQVSYEVVDENKITKAYTREYKTNILSSDHEQKYLSYIHNTTHEYIIILNISVLCDYNV